MKYVYIYPDNWNKIKFLLERGSVAVYANKLPDYVVNFLNLIGVGFISYMNFICSDMDIYDFIDQNSIKIKKTKKEKTVIDYETMSKSWNDIEDEKTCWIEANYKNICSTIQFLKNKNYKKFIENGYEYKIIFWEETKSFLNEKQKKFIEKFQNDLVFDSFENEKKYANRINVLEDDQNDDWITKINKIDISQIINDNGLKCYRRNAINNYFGWTANYEWSKIVYVSYLPKNNIYNYDKMIFDRSDNWTAKGLDETWILDAADAIICSSKWLYNDTKKKQPKKEVFYIPNGNYDYTSEKVEKYEQKTAIYAGAQIRKADIQKIIDIAKANPEWTIKIYTEDCEWMEILSNNIKAYNFVDNETIFKEVEKCHVGLCTLSNNNFVKGMLPDKIFLYGNAGIPCIYSGIADENVEDYKWCIKYSDDLNLDNYLNKEYSFKKRTWNDVCLEINNVVERLKIKWFE